MEARLLLILVLSGAVAGRAQGEQNRNRCSTRCPDNVNFQYEKGWTYEYRYEAETRTTMAGAAEDTATVAITATARIEVLGHCDMALQLTDVVIKRSHEERPGRMVGADDMSRARGALEGRSLRFAFHDGAVGDLCPDGQEELWALNVKRGVLSSFQNSMHQLEREEHVQETDVAGQCPTHYRVTQQGWKSLTVTKAKDILACTHRHDHRTALLSVPYSAPNSVQSLPLMKTSHECSQDISKEDAILQRSTCHEVHVFRPFSKVNNGAVTEASHSLTFRTKSRGTRTAQGRVERRTTLLYEHKQGVDKGSSLFMNVKSKLEEICDITKTDIRPQVPRMFGELVHMIRNLRYSELQDLSKQIERRRICRDNSQKIRQFFRDALPMAGTASSLQMMADLLMSGEVGDSQATFWMTSLAFLSNPTADMISALQPLLSDAQTQEEAMLAVSSLVNNFCSHQEDCTQHQAVVQVLDTLTAILGPQCQVGQDNFKQVLVALRAIGNIGRSETVALQLQKCFTQDDLPMDVRVAALDAYRRMPCSADRNDVMELFLRHSEDSELRIAAYLTVMQCPSDPVLTQVRQALLDEEVNQVGSFVWTHLTNLLETESPHKQAVRELLENDLLQKEFSKDRRKFSRNTEVSFFSDNFNLGGTLESNVVWSPNSFIPRSAMVNLTVDMFGQSVNLLEVGGRVQGLQYLLHTYFGADNSGKEGGYGQSDVVKNSKLVRTKADYGKVKDSLRGQVYMRVFGNELAFRQLDEGSIDRLRSGKADSLFEGLSKKLMTEGQVSFTHSAVFLDTTLVIPTVAGLPLNLTVNGSASLELQASQKMDFKKIQAKSKAFEVAAMIEPSGAVEVAAVMSVDAFVTRVGLKMVSRLHTSTALKGRVELARGQILSAELDTPRDTLDIFDFQSKFFILHDTSEKEQQMVVANRREKTACTGEALARIVGMELCASLSFPNASTALGAPYFPFTGPTAVTLALRKHDVHSGYRLLAKQIRTGSSVITQVALDTPGSKVDRAISLGYVAHLKAKTLEADLLSPWKKVSANMSVSTNKKHYKADAVIVVDTKKVYKVHLQVDKDVRKQKDLVIKVKPSLEVNSPEGQLLSVKGSVDYKQNKVVRSSLVVEMKDVLKKPISVDYTLVMRGRQDKMRYKNSLKLSSQFATMKGSLQALVGSFSAKKKAALLTLRSRLDYNLHLWPSVKRNVVSLGLKLNDRSTAALSKYGVSMTFDSKRSPEANLLVNGEVSHKKTLTKVEMKVRHGHNVKLKADKSKEMVLSGFVAHKIADPKAVVSFDLQARYPDKALEYQLKGKHEHSKHNMEDYLTLRYAKGKSVDAHMRLTESKKKRSATFDLTYPAGKTYPARTVKFNAELVQKSADHHVLSALLAPQKGEKHSLVVSYKQPTDNSMELSSEVGIHKRQPIKLDLSGNYALRNMQGQGKLTFEGQTYQLAYSSDIHKNRYANFSMSFVHPERRIEAHLEGGRDLEEMVKRGRMEVSWDADNDPSQKIGVTAEIADKINPEDLNFGGMVEVFTPFKECEHVKGELRLENSRRRILTVAETVLGDREKVYSAKFMLARPVSENQFKTQAWLKTPHPVLQHLEVKADHVFDASGKLSSALKGQFNRHSVQMGVSGSRKGDLVVQELEGVAYFKSTLRNVQGFRLTFNHRDTNGRYYTQTLLDVDGNQYSAIMEADFTKVHYQVSTSGEVRIRVPQLSSPVKVAWKHNNNLHELSSSVTVDLPNNQQVLAKVDGQVNIVTKVYEVHTQLSGPWKENGAQHTSKGHVNYAVTRSGYDLSASLELENDKYDFHETLKQTAAGMEITSGLKMSRFPQYSLQCTFSLKHSDFPYVFSLEAKLAKKPLLNVDVEVEHPRPNRYRSSSRLAFSLEDDGQNIVQNIAMSTRHEKNRQGQWITKGDIDYDVGKKITYNSVLTLEKERKMVNVEIDTPFEEARNIRMEYSHFGNGREGLIASCSLTVDPLFDTISTAISWSNQDKFRGNVRVDTPFEELRYLEMSTQSWMQGDRRHSVLKVDYPPNQKYKLDTVYGCTFPRDMGITVNLTTPHKELPSLHSHIGYQYSDAEMNGDFRLITPALKYDELSVSFSQKQGLKSFSSQAQTVIGAGNTWTTRTDFSWDEEIAGLISVENNGDGRQKTHLILSHRGQTWHDFRTKASFKMNGDRLESEVAYSDLDGRSGLFMLATPDPDIDFFKTTFFQRLTEDEFEGRYTVQYGEASKPYDLGLSTAFSDDMIGFSTGLKTPHSEDLEIQIGFARKRRVEIKLFGMYGTQNKINILAKYVIRKELWNVGGEFEYLVQGSGRNVGLLFKRDGPLDNLKCSSSAKYMGKEVNVDAHYKDGNKKMGTLAVRSNFKDYTNLSASFDHSGTSERFQTNVDLKYKDDKEAKASVEFQRNKWKRIEMTTTVHLPYQEFQENKLTYKQVNRKNKVSAEGSLKLGRAQAIKGELNFVDNKKLTVSVMGPYKDFESFTSSGTYDEADKRLEGEALIKLSGQPEDIRATYLVTAGVWPVVANVKAQTPFEGWRDVELVSSQDGGWSDFTSSYSLTADAVGTVQSDVIWSYTSPSLLNGLWTLTSSVEGAENLKLSLRNTQTGNRYTSNFLVGWELLKELYVDTTVQLDDISNNYKGSISMASPFPEAKQVSVSFDHSHDDQVIQDTVVAEYNHQQYLDADFHYSVGDKRVGSIVFREPRPMEFEIAGRYTETTVEGELKLNWDRRDPVMNVHLTGEYTDRSDPLGADINMKVWAVHPVRTMGVEYLLKKAVREFQNDVLLTWDKAAGQTVSYVINWTDRSSRFSSAYDAMVKVGAPTRSVQVQGLYSDTGRVRAAEGAVLWDVDRDQNMKLGLKGQLDRRANTNKLQLGLDLPFVSKEYSLTTEATVNAANVVLDARTEFSYSTDPRRLLVFTSRLKDLSYGQHSLNYSLALGLLHPVTDVDLQMTSHVGHSPAGCALGTSVVYMTSQREKKTVELRGQFDKLRRTMGVELQSPVKQWSLEGQLSGDQDYNVQLVSNENGRRSRVTEIYINPEKRILESTFWYDQAAPGNSLKVLGHLVTDRQLQTELYRMEQGRRVSETLVTLRLNSSNVLHSRVNWRPNMLTDLQQYVGLQLTRFGHQSSEGMKAVAGSVGQEVQAKYTAIMQEIQKESAPLLQHFQREMESLQKDLDLMQTNLRRFYYRNALNVKEFSSVTDNILESVIMGMQGLLLRFQQLQGRLQQDIAEFGQQMGQYPMAQKYAQLVADFAGGLKNSRVILEEALDVLGVQLGKFSDLTYRKYLVISRQINRKLQGYTAALHESPQYQGLAQAYNSARAGLGRLSYGNYKQLADAANARLLTALDSLGLKEPYLALVTKSKQLVADQFQDLVQRPEFQQVYVIGSEIYQQGVWAYHYWHVEQKAHMAVGQLLELAKNVALLELIRIKNAVVDLDKSRIIVFDPQNGELQFEIYLPVSLKSLAEPPDLRVTKYINRVRSWAATYIPSQRHSLWTSINSYLPNMDTDTWLPPYTAHAFVLGDQHVVTFDQRHYNFAGRCSYILARDMADDRFTVILHYNNRPRHPQVQSIIVLLRGVAVEVDREGKVTVNQQETELPYFSGIISAVRQRSIIRVQDGQALSVEIDNSRGIYSVVLSGWYHGRTAGLLGTYDNEPSNDLTDSRRQLAQDVEAFSNSWEVSRRHCRSRNMAHVGDLDPEAPEVLACREFLAGSSSYFSPCFGQVEASELVSVCVGYVRKGLSLQDAKCKAGQHYRYVCRQLGIGLGTPAECVSCELAAGQPRLELGQKQVVEGKRGKGSRSADVVFIVEESTCNQWARQSLPAVATHLSQALTQEGLTGNRFGLITYSGNGSQDQQLMHTIEGQEFGEPRNFLKATENLRVAYLSQPGNAEAAVRRAVQYPFRVGVAKLLVLLPCSVCNGDLYMLGQVLTAHGFRLHVLTEHNFTLSASHNASPVRIFGVTNQQAYTQKSAASKSGDLFHKLAVPRGRCAQLGLSTNGSLFDTSHLQARRRVQKEFLESFAAQSAQGAVPPRCEICSCHDDGAGHGHTVCRLCDNSSWMWNHIPMWLQSSSNSVMELVNDLHHQVITSLDIPEVASSA